MSYSSITHAIIWYVESHLKSEIFEYSDLEKQIGFSYAHIRDLFRNNTGHSLAKYIRMRKMWLSAFELQHSTQTILDIALEYGFSSQESYTRTFQKVVGMTPGRFRKEKMVLGKDELTTGVYGIGFLGKKEHRSDMDMNKEKYMNNDSTILFGVPKVEYGAFGGNTPFPICLKACSDYLGEMIEYSQIMVDSAAAFRFAWNEKKWDLSNVDIYHTFEESNEIYGIGAKALGREFDWLCREQTTTKEEFISFIKKHLDEGYPCIALGIIGPPEACLITGYREKGEVLLGWNFFQNDPDFAGSVEQDECGYFISRNWWENADTQAVMCMGPICRETMSHDNIVKNAVRAMTGRRERDYCKGILAYEAWKNSLLDEDTFHVGDNYSVLFEKLLCQNDAITCLRDGRGQAAKYFGRLASVEKDASQKQRYIHLEKLFGQIAETMGRMQSMFGNWGKMDQMLENLASDSVRKKACQMINTAAKWDREALKILSEILV